VSARSLDELIPADHFYRYLDRVLDLSFVRDLVRETYAAQAGRPSIDPVVFFKLQLVMIFKGIRSERQLLRLAADRLSVRWYLGYNLDEPLPDHSSLTRIRTRFSLEVFRRFFEAIVAQCQQAGLVWGRELYFDATQVQADAALDSLTARFAVEARQAPQARAARQAQEARETVRVPMQTVEAHLEALFPQDESDAHADAAVSFPPLSQLRRPRPGCRSRRCRPWSARSSSTGREPSSPRTANSPSGTTPPTSICCAPWSAAGVARSPALVGAGSGAMPIISAAPSSILSSRGSRRAARRASSRPSRWTRWSGAISVSC
jgi:transposase